MWEKEEKTLAVNHRLLVFLNHSGSTTRVEWSRKKNNLIVVQ